VAAGGRQVGLAEARPVDEEDTVTSASAPPPRSGLLLPPGVVQPFFLRFDPDDWHVMALLDGHPTYEAVEAMVRARPEGGWTIRAIITRHDGRQTDHVNDPALLAAMRGARREVVKREIAFAIDAAGPRPAARVTFVSAAGEPIELNVFGLGPPDPRGAGLSDPGTHSADASLPLMWRRASALAAEGTNTLVAGRRYEAPARMLRPGLTAREGYLTAGHSMGVIRAGEVETQLLRAPRGEIAPGDAWAFEAEGESVVWRVTERTTTRDLLVERQGAAREVLSARQQGDRLELFAVAVPDRDGMVLMLENGRFELGVAGQSALIRGQVETDGSVVTLRPESPEWAVSRPVRVAMARRDETITITTTIG
jgi:hypothetical protein